MGCNYYLRPKGFDEIEQVNRGIEIELEMITNKYKSDIYNIIISACNKYPIYEELLDLPSITDIFTQMQWEVEIPEIHICKMSLGWIPCFQVNKMYKTCKEFLDFYGNNKDKFILINEYNEEVDIEQFKKDLQYFKERAIPENRRDDCYNVRYYKDIDGFDWIDSDFS